MTLYESSYWWHKTLGLYFILCFIGNSLIYFLKLPIWKPCFCIWGWSFDWKISFSSGWVGFLLSYLRVVGKRIGPVVQMEKWNSSKWRNMSVMQDTQVGGFVLALKYFFYLNMGKKPSYLTKEELWVKTCQWRIWRNELALTVQLQGFRFSLFLFSCQTRRLKIQGPSWKELQYESVGGAEVREGASSETSRKDRDKNNPVPL